MLSLSTVSSAYGSAQVLNGASLSVQAGEVLALLGRNGVGKTTLMKTIMNLVAPTGGEIMLDGRRLNVLQTHEIARAGVGYVPQGRGIFDKLTVLENLEMGLRCNSKSKAVIPPLVYDRFPILHERRSQVAGTLSGGQKQQLAISRALCGGPKILLLDEPSEGIQPNIVQDIGAFIRHLVETQNIAVLMVEQNLNLVKGAASRFAMMVRGEIVHEGAVPELDDENLLQKYLSV
jgi:urea ABC transporter ATP-binding protein UrtE